MCSRVDEARATCELLIARGLKVSTLDRVVARLSLPRLDVADVETSRLELEGVAEAANERRWPITAIRLARAADMLREAEQDMKRLH